MPSDPCSDAMEGGEAGEEQELILYDIVTYREWEQEPEVFTRMYSTHGVGGGLEEDHSL